MDLHALQDIRKLASERAVDICRWAAQAMLDAALREQNEAAARKIRKR